MAKPPKPPPDAQPLKHSPFANLRGLQTTPEPAAAAPSGPEARAQEISPPRSEISAASSVNSTAQSAVAGPGAAAGAPRSRGRLLQRRETKHRAGKAVIVVSGFEQLRDFDEAALLTLARELKQALGCGGTLETRDGQRELVLQGDRAAQVAELLRARGFRVDGVTR